MRVRSSIFLALFFAVSLVFGQIKSPKELVKEAKKSIVEITASSLNKKVASGDIILLDVRTEKEYKAGHIEGAKWAPRGKLEFMIKNITDDPNAKIYIYCKKGGRAALASANLVKMGYKKVFSLKGGFVGWAKKGYEAVNAHGKIKVVGVAGGH